MSNLVANQQDFFTSIKTKAQLYPIINSLQRETKSSIYFNFLEELSAGLMGRTITIPYARNALTFIFQHPDTFTLPPRQSIDEMAFNNKDAVVAGLQKLPSAYLDLVPTNHHITITGFIEELTSRNTPTRGFFDCAMTFAIALFEAKMGKASSKMTQYVDSTTKYMSSEMSDDVDSTWYPTSSDNSSDDSDDVDDTEELVQMFQQLTMGKKYQIVKL